MKFGLKDSESLWKSNAVLNNDGLILLLLYKDKYTKKRKEITQWEFLNSSISPLNFIFWDNFGAK